MNDSIFINNSANDGGVIYNYGGTATVTDSIFIDNSATYGGGGIYIDGGTGTATNNIFIGNSATYGGGIYSGIGPQGKLGTLINTGNLFFDNTGGDIYP